ncbi:MAG TPA: YheC/YheD family protein [Symbiobacteriaceae bacterium]
MNRFGSSSPELAEPETRRTVLGLLLRRGWLEVHPFGDQTAFAQQVTKLGRKAEVEVICFGPEDVDRTSRRLSASRYLGPRRGWVREQTPLPDVLWNRCLRQDHDGLLAWFAEQSVPSINSACLNKWEMYQCLRSDEMLQPHLPETLLVTGGETVVEMLQRHPVVLLKPLMGTGGRGILRGRLSGLGVMQFEFVSAETGMLKEAYVEWEQLDRWLQRRKAAGRYIVQQELSLAVFYGRVADLRVLVQKDGQGCWSVTGMGCRVARNGHFTANLQTGGQGVPADLLLEAVAPDPGQREALQERVASLALRAAHQIEACLGPMGELGLDFGLDRRGDLWLLEANALPGREIFAHMAQWELWEEAHLRPVLYARYLVTGKEQQAAPAEAT